MKMIVTPYLGDWQEPAEAQPYSQNMFLASRNLKFLLNSRFSLRSCCFDWFLGLFDAFGDIFISFYCCHHSFMLS